MCRLETVLLLTGIAALCGGIWASAAWAKLVARDARAALLGFFQASDKPWDAEQELGKFRTSVKASLEWWKATLQGEALDMRAEAEKSIEELVNKAIARHIASRKPFWWSPSPRQMACVWASAVITAIWIYQRTETDFDMSYHFGTLLQVACVWMIGGLAFFSLRTGRSG